MDMIKSASVDRGDRHRRFFQENAVERECREVVESMTNTDVALVITGVRRCDKSFLA